MWENTTPSTRLPRDFYDGIGLLQLGVMLVSFIFSTGQLATRRAISTGREMQSAGGRLSNYASDCQSQVHFNRAPNTQGHAIGRMTV